MVAGRQKQLLMALSTLSVRSLSKRYQSFAPIERRRRCIIIAFSLAKGSLTPLVLAAVFQQLETDYYISPPNKNIYPTELLEVPVIRMFGVTEQGEYRSHACSDSLLLSDRPCCWQAEVKAIRHISRGTCSQATACASLCTDLSHTSSLRRLQNSVLMTATR